MFNTKQKENKNYQSQLCLYYSILLRCVSGFVESHNHEM